MKFADSNGKQYDAPKTIDGIKSSVFFTEDTSGNISTEYPCFQMEDGSFRIPVFGMDSSGATIPYWKKMVLIPETQTAKKLRIVFANFPYIPGYGTFKHKQISQLEASNLCHKASGFLSAIGHQATADVMSELFGMKIEMNRITYEYENGDIMLILKLNSRLPEGMVLSRDDLEKIGYSLSILEFVS